MASYILSNGSYEGGKAGRGAGFFVLDSSDSSPCRTVLGQGGLKREAYCRISSKCDIFAKIVHLPVLFHSTFMKIYDSFDTVINDYFILAPQAAGFDTWTIAKFIHTSDDAYRQLVSAGKDTLGYQPTMLTLADPLNQQKDEVIIRNLPTASYAAVRQQYTHRFVEQLPGRFGLFYSDKKQADAIFTSWEEFARDWLERGGQNLLPYNLPLLFDHVSDAEYWGWQQKGFDPCGTQRLIITVFQYRTGRFADVFITGVSDAEMARIRMLVMSRLTIGLEDTL